jgi:hypothetical protein
MATNLSGAIFGIFVVVVVFCRRPKMEPPKLDAIEFERPLLMILKSELESG